MSDSQTTGDEVAGDPVATPATAPVIESVGDLVNLLGTLEPGQQTWYREQVDRGWPLVPSAMRKAGWFPAEGDMLKLFRQEAAGRTGMSPTHEWDWVCLAQHHRLPTRLLDWSTNPLLGLYFAAEFDEGGASDAEGGLYSLDPAALNERSLGSPNILLLGADRDLDGNLLSSPSPAEARSCRRRGATVLRPVVMPGVLCRLLAQGEQPAQQVGHRDEPAHSLGL